MIKNDSIEKRRKDAEAKGLTYRSGQKHSMFWFHQNGTYDQGIKKRKKKWRLGSHPLARRD